MTNNVTENRTRNGSWNMTVNWACNCTNRTVNWTCNGRNMTENLTFNGSLNDCQADNGGAAVCLFTSLEKRAIDVAHGLEACLSILSVAGGATTLIKIKKM